MKLLVIGTFAHIYNPRLLLVEVLGSTLPIVYEKPTCASVCYVRPSPPRVGGVVDFRLCNVNVGVWNLEIEHMRATFGFEFTHR